MTGSVNVPCEAILTTAAGTGGVKVVLASSNSAAVFQPSMTIPAGSSNLWFHVTCTAVSSTQTATLSASEGGVSITFVLTLNAAPALLSVSSSKVAFGDVALNSPATQTISLGSTGIGPVTVSSAKLTGTGFSLAGASFPLTLNPSQTATLDLEFDPTAAGAATGALTLTSNSAGGASTVVTLTGTGEAASSYQVNLSWNAPSGSTMTIAGYHVYRATSGSSSYALLDSSIDAGTTYSDITVSAGAAYDYYVESVDSAGVSSAPSSVFAISIP